MLNSVVFGAVAVVVVVVAFAAVVVLRKKPVDPVVCRNRDNSLEDPFVTSIVVGRSIDAYRRNLLIRMSLVTAGDGSLETMHCSHLVSQ